VVALARISENGAIPLRNEARRRAFSAESPASERRARSWRYPKPTLAKKGGQCRKQGGEYGPEDLTLRRKPGFHPRESLSSRLLDDFAGKFNRASRPAAPQRSFMRKSLSDPVKSGKPAAPIFPCSPSMSPAFPGSFLNRREISAGISSGLTRRPQNTSFFGPENAVFLASKPWIK
jgi:hypothetical protein